MDPVRTRLAAWMTWAGYSNATLAKKLGCDASYPRKIQHGRRPGLVLALAIERESGSARDDGEVWPDGPISVSEWGPDALPEETKGAA